MKEVFGDVKSLSPNERESLEKLADKRTGGGDVIDGELLKKAVQLSTRLGVQIGLIIGRDGRVTHVVYGSRDRIYLPDLGRFRLDSARLRRLRLVVCMPEAEGCLCSRATEELIFRAQYGEHEMTGKSYVVRRTDSIIQAPEIAPDLFTDLEKLRFDALVVVAPDARSAPGQAVMAYLEPWSSAVHYAVQKTSKRGERAIGVLAAKSVAELVPNFDLFVSELETRLTVSRPTGHDTGKDGAILVGAYSGSAAEATASMEELKELARTAGLQILDSVIQRRRKLDPKTVIGKGKLEDLVLHTLDLGADLIVFDRELSPGQLRSITNLTELRVIDRSMLILDIFAQRAKSSEGRLQVELAQLKYSLPRLTETDTGLSRLTGGIGGRGPGETKLEIGRRRARDRITMLEKKIDQVSEQRGLRRERRQERGVPVIAIVGYTNAGKSTLLNSLTKGDVLVENKLFATLDPSSRRMRFPSEREVVFVDTVGFIRELPKELVNAFRATLEEVAEADVLVHVVDAAEPEMRMQIDVVVKTLEGLKITEKPRILVLNKIDLLSQVEVQMQKNSLNALAVSAAERIGFEELVARIEEALPINSL